MFANALAVFKLALTVALLMAILAGCGTIETMESVKVHPIGGPDCPQGINTRTGKTVYATGVAGYVPEDCLAAAIEHANWVRPDVLELNGAIMPGDAQRVAMPGQTMILRDMPGGTLRDAYLIASKVRELGLNTHVEGDCNSACTLIWQAGATRTMGQGARLGFHKWDNPADSEAVLQDILATWTTMTDDNVAMIRALWSSAEHDDMTYLDRADAMALGLI